VVTYTITDLGTLGGPSSRAYDLNNLGQVVGEAQTVSMDWHAFKWESGVMSDLGTLGEASSIARGINDAGQVVGAAGNGTDVRRAFLWDDSLLELDTLGAVASYAEALNEAGQIVGGLCCLNSPPSVALWQSGTGQALRLSNYGSSATDINERGQIVGGRSEMEGVGCTGPQPSGCYAQFAYAFVWQAGVGSTDLPTLGRARDAVNQARAINDTGQVVGVSTAASGAQLAVLWQNGSVLSLGTLGGTSSTAADINNRGQVVGSSLLPLEICTPFCGGTK